MQLSVTQSCHFHLKVSICPSVTITQNHFLPTLRTNSMLSFAFNNTVVVVATFLFAPSLQIQAVIKQVSEEHRPSQRRLSHFSFTPSRIYNAMLTPVSLRDVTDPFLHYRGRTWPIVQLRLNRSRWRKREWQQWRAEVFTSLDTTSSNHHD